MNKTQKLIKRGFESSSYKTPEFTAFSRTFKSEFKKVLNELKCTGLECSIGHFFISGFFNSPSGQLYYFSIGDVRWGKMIAFLYAQLSIVKTIRVDQTNTLDLKI